MGRKLNPAYREKLRERLALPKCAFCGRRRRYLSLYECPDGKERRFHDACFPRYLDRLEREAERRAREEQAEIKRRAERGKTPDAVKQYWTGPATTWGRRARVRTEAGVGVDEDESNDTGKEDEVMPKIMNEAVKMTGCSDRGAYHRAVEIARQLWAIGRWDGKSTIIVHNSYEVHRCVQWTDSEGYHAGAATTLHSGIRDLVEGPDGDYEIIEEC